MAGIKIVFCVCLLYFAFFIPLLYSLSTEDRFFKASFHISGKFQTIGDFTFYRTSQILLISEN